MKVWRSYKAIVFKNFGIHDQRVKDLPFYRDYLFAMTLLYFMPLSLIAIVPSLILSLSHGYFTIVLFDVIALLLLPLLVFSKRIKIQYKKILFSTLAFALGTVLLASLGFYGPGLMYLLIASVFTVIIFPSRYALLPVFINTFICIGYGLALHFQWMGVTITENINALSWAVISVNLIFLSVVFSFLIPKIFDGLQTTIEQQFALKGSLETSLKTLELQNNELEQFTYVVSHDLQEPLRMISSFLTLLEKRYGGALDKKAHQYIHFAVDGADRMRQIILDLLEFAYIGQHEEELGPINLNDLMAEIRQLNRKKIEETGASLSWKELHTIPSYRTPLLQIFQNLVNNSLKYHREDAPPEIEVKSKREGDAYVISVKDNGIGIDPEFIDKVFVIFQRLHSANEYSGSGIGLAIVKKSAEYLGGHIRVESNPGMGSTFFLTLPVQKDIPNEPVAPPFHLPPLQSKTPIATIL